MKKIALMIILSSVAGVADAGPWSSWQDFFNWWNSRFPVTTTQVTATAPEIDPASTASALTLLIGGLTVLRSRMGKKN